MSKPMPNPEATKKIAFGTKVMVVLVSPPAFSEEKLAIPLSMAPPLQIGEPSFIATRSESPFSAAVPSL